MYMYNRIMFSHVAPCSSNNGGCTQLCFSHRVTSYRCRCAIGYELDVIDESTCNSGEKLSKQTLGASRPGKPFALVIFTKPFLMFS